MGAQAGLRRDKMEGSGGTTIENDDVPCAAALRWSIMKSGMILSSEFVAS